MKKLRFLLPVLLVILVICTNTFKSYASGTQIPVGEDYVSFYNLNSSGGYVESYTSDSLYAYAVEKGITHLNGSTYSTSLPSLSVNCMFELFYNNVGFNLLSSMPNLTNGYDYSNDTDYDISSYSDTVVNTFGDGYGAPLICRFNGTNGRLIFDNGGTGRMYYVSDEPFDYYVSQVSYNAQNDAWAYSWIWQWPTVAPRHGIVSDTSSVFTGKYAVDVPYFAWSFNVTPQLQFTNTPIYVCRNDLEPNFTPTAIDGTHININYLLEDGTFPSEEDEPINMPVSDKYNLSFRMSNVFAGSLTNIWHYIGNLHFNSYIEAHPERFWFCANYIVQYQDDHMATPKTFYYGGTDLMDATTISQNIGMMAYRATGDINGDLPNDWAYGLHLSDFRDENDVSLVTYIATTMNRVTGTNTTYVNIDDLLLVDPVAFINSLITGRQPVLKEVAPLYESSILKFQLRSEVFVSTEDPGNGTDNTDGYDSNPNICTYDFLNGNTKVISSDNTYEPNKPPVSGEEDGEQIVVGNPPSTSSGGGNTTYGGPVAKIESGAIVIKNGPQNELVVDVGALESFKSIIETLKTEILDKKDDSFIAIIKENYELFPVPVLNILIIGACVMVFAGFIKVVTRR